MTDTRDSEALLRIMHGVRPDVLEHIHAELERWRRRIDRLCSENRELGLEIPTVIADNVELSMAHALLTDLVGAVRREVS